MSFEFFKVDDSKIVLECLFDTYVYLLYKSPQQYRCTVEGQYMLSSIRHTLSIGMKMEPWEVEALAYEKHKNKTNQ